MSNRQGIARIVNVTEAMQEHLRVQAFMQRRSKEDVLIDALEAFYGDASDGAYEREKPLRGRFFVRLPADETGKLEAWAAVTSMSMSEVIRRALAKDINAHNGS